MELLFLLAFTLHNIEEGLWLPRWSVHAGKYHQPVTPREFHFALFVITSVSYLLGFLKLQFAGNMPVFAAIFGGFVLMMVLNAVFPHLLASLVLRRYAPGTFTGLLLNLPIGCFILRNYIAGGVSIGGIIIATAVITPVTLGSLRPLFRLGAKLIDEY